ncbi:MAG: hypothetical protein J3K34DRAFT_515839 [Monoraphidium minutum]|nr:MAG: hypothetical protein J3K34DRAFT_515839 [Monoraphidium minutum]
MSAPGGGPAAGGAKPAAGAPPGSFKVQCVGLVKTEGAAGGANPVLNVLRGMCSRYESFERVEYGCTAPLQSGTASASLKLFKHRPPKAASNNPFAPPNPAIWTLVHESTPMRGPVYASLPAAVREVSEANLYTQGQPVNNGLEFLEALGARVEYAVQKNGNYYVCHHQGLEIQVLVYSVAALAPGSNPTNLGGKHWMLEATADAGAEKQIEVARLMGSFAARLLPHVELKRPL